MSDASDVRRKRNGSAEAPSKKRLKKDKEDKENDEDEEIDSKCTPQEIVEIRKIMQLLKKAYEDAPKATNNALIYNRVCPVPWNLILYEMKPLKSLANRLLNEEGWTADRMRKRIGTSQTPISIFPLNRAESRALWESIVYRVKMDKIYSTARFDIEIPETWLDEKYQGKTFKRDNAVAYGMELLAVIVFHQKTFLAKKPFHFRSICDDLGWELSAAFCDYFYPILFVICANPSLVKTSTASIKGQWGTSTNQNKVKKALKEAAKAAEESQNIKYKETFKLLKIIFPQLLK